MADVGGAYVQPDCGGSSSESEPGLPADNASCVCGWKEGYQDGYNMAVAVIRVYGLPPESLESAPVAESCDEPPPKKGRATIIAAGGSVPHPPLQPHDHAAGSMAAAAPRGRKRARDGSTQQHMARREGAILASSGVGREAVLFSCGAHVLDEGVRQDSL